MCGIVGIASLSEESLGTTDKKIIKEMAAVTTHRGPDSQDFYFSDKIFYGNNRLSILDPTPRSNLPFISECENYILCYNGEVTNYIELAAKYDLRKKYNIKTTSDTEIVLLLYIEIGEKFLNELSGMFALSLYDKIKGKLIIARDPFGINPLFYFHSNNKFYFSSEIKSLLEIPGFERRVNTTALYDYFTLAYPQGTHTMFENITEVRNGQAIRIDLATGEFQKFYFYRMSYKTDHSINFSEATTKVRQMLTESVERNLRSDEPVGTTLSGGIDTSGIVGLIGELGKSKDLHTFSIKMGESSFDESHFQRLVSQRYKTNHHEIQVLPEEVEKHFYDHIVSLDEPSGNGAPIPIYILAKHAKKYVKVLLSGEGGDEIFNAYSVYQAWKVRKYYLRFVPKIFRKCIFSAVHALPSNYSKLSFDFQAKRFTEGCELHPAAAHIYWRHPFTNAEKDRFLKYHHRSTDQVVIDLYDEYSHTEELNRIAMLDIEHFITDDLLLKNDRMFYAHSIEGRYPYLDRELIDYVQTIPTKFKLKGLKGRYIQKQALKDVLPKDVYKRQNYGLEMPHSVWFLKELKHVLDRFLNKNEVEKTGLFEWEPINEMIQAHMNGKRDYGRGLWSLTVFIAWHKLYIQTSDYKQYI